MPTRFLLSSCHRTIFFFLLISLGCSAQLSQNELGQRIEHQLRVTYRVPPTVKVSLSALHASEFPNYDGLTITFDDGGQKKTYEFLVSKDQKTLIRMSKMDLSKDAYAEVMKKIDVSGRPVRGNRNAKVVVISYDDFECPYCAAVHKTLFPTLLNEYKDRVAFIYKDFPLSGHPWAVHAAVNANCLGAQSQEAYWDFADYVHSHQDTFNSEKTLEKQFAALDQMGLSEGNKFKLDSAKLESCVKAQKDDAVKASIKEGDALGVDGTPTLVVNGQMLTGAFPTAELRQVFDKALEQAGVPPSSSHPSSTAAAAPEPSPRDRTRAPQ
jgi:protein-disulfide isomerase